MDFVSEKLGKNVVAALGELQHEDESLELAMKAGYLATDTEFLSQVTNQSENFQLFPNKKKRRSISNNLEMKTNVCIILCLLKGCEKWSMCSKCTVEGWGACCSKCG